MNTFAEIVKRPDTCEEKSEFEDTSEERNIFLTRLLREPTVRRLVMREHVKGGGMGMERDFAWGGGHNMQCAADVSMSCTLETCMVL